MAQGTPGERVPAGESTGAGVAVARHGVPSSGAGLDRSARGLVGSPSLKGVGGVVLLAAVAAVPLVAPTHYTLLMLSFFAYSIALLGLNLLFGYTGLLSFGHALFLALGAYTAAVLTSRLGVRSMEVVVVVGALVALVVAAPVGALCVRYVKISFGMLTLAFGMLFWSFLVKFYHLTGADQGIPVRTPTVLGIEAAAGEQIAFLTGPYYYYAAALLLLLGFAMWRIVRSPFGLCLRAIRENPVKAEYLGISVKRYRWYAFLISAAYAAVGGALLAPISGLADPTLAYWTQSGLLVFMTLLGGFSSFLGPVLGAFVFIFLQDRVMAQTEYWRLVFGAMLALVVIFAPNGLVGLAQMRWRKGRSVPGA